MKDALQRLHTSFQLLHPTSLYEPMLHALALSGIATPKNQYICFSSARYPPKIQSLAQGSIPPAKPSPSASVACKFCSVSILSYFSQN